MYLDFLAAGLIVVAFERLFALKEQAALEPVTSVVDEFYRQAHEAYRAHDYPRAPKERQESVVVTTTTAPATKWTSSTTSIYITTTPTAATTTIPSPPSSPSTPSAPGSPGTPSTTSITLTTATTGTTVTTTNEIVIVTLETQSTITITTTATTISEIDIDALTTQSTTTTSTTVTTATTTTTASTVSDPSTKIPPVREDKPRKDEKRSACDWHEVSRIGSPLKHPYKLLTQSETEALQRTVAHAHELRSKLDESTAKANGLGEVLDYLVIKPLSASCSASLTLQWNLKILSQVENRNVTQIWTVFNAALVQILQPSLYVRSKPEPGRLSTEGDGVLAAIYGESFRDEGFEDDRALFEDVFNMWKGVEKKRETLRDTMIDTKQDIFYPAGTESGVSLSVRLIEIAILLPFCIVTAVIARLLILRRYRRVGNPRAGNRNLNLQIGNPPVVIPPVGNAQAGN
ncbi:hypothetical protein F4678DRAFT_483145 [Xylaria arbuscula]|nr:hypothetical protein F4678DRAFT_483145 [Xylaria arbuscula]